MKTRAGRYEWGSQLKPRKEGASKEKMNEEYATEDRQGKGLPVFKKREESLWKRWEIHYRRSGRPPQKRAVLGGVFNRILAAKKLAKERIKVANLTVRQRLFRKLS